MSVVTRTPTFLDICSIYFEHYGQEEIALRKRHYSASLLARSSLMRILRSRNQVQAIDQDHMCRRLAVISKRLDEDGIAFRLPYRFRRYYRNQLYPAEIEDPESVFYGASIRRLDALLLDRPDNGQYFQVRGKYSDRSDRTSWLVKINDTRRQRRRF